MNKTEIPWCDYTVNPVKGLCPMACSYCYARRMYKRFKWDETIRLDVAAIHEIHSIKEPSRIFVGSTIELFGVWVEPKWYDYIWGMVKGKPQHTFIFLTKQPQNLIKWSPFPENVWVGVSVTDAEDNAPLGRSIYTGFDKVKASVKFISFEPLLEDVRLDYRDLEWTHTNWLIIGSQTQPVKHPPREWVDEIITAADEASISVFVKEPLASHYDIQRQEFPD